MARGESIVLDDTSCFRSLRHTYREFARENSYIAELVYLDVSLEEVQTRMVENRMTAARPAIELEVFEMHIEKFEPPQTDEVATVLGNSEDVSRWVESCLRPL